MRKLQSTLYYTRELTYRIFYTAVNTIFIFAISYRYKQVLIYLILPQGLSHLITTEITEIFITYISICALVTTLINLNVLLVQIYFFLRPGLYLFEADIASMYLIGCLTLYFYFYVVIYPMIIQVSWKFFTAYIKNFKSVQLIFEPKLNNYFYYVKNIGFLLMILSPGILISMAVLTYIKYETILQYRKYIYILITVAATLATPPDLISQLILVIILIKLYEALIFIRLILQKYKKLIRQPIKTNKYTGDKKQKPQG